MKQLHLEILTPDGEALRTEVEAVNLAGLQGRLGILPNHTSLISTLVFGPLSYRQNGVEKTVLCGEGFVEVADNRVSVLVRSAENAEQIDADRARGALERSRSRLGSKGREIDLARAEKAFARAQARLRFLNQI